MSKRIIPVSRGELAAAQGMVDDRRMSEGALKSKQELLLAAYQAFNARDIDVVLAMMHADVDWPNGMEGGR